MFQKLMLKLRHCEKATKFEKNLPPILTLPGTLVSFKYVDFWPKISLFRTQTASYTKTKYLLMHKYQKDFWGSLAQLSSTEEPPYVTNRTHRSPVVYGVSLSGSIWFKSMCKNPMLCSQKCCALHYWQCHLVTLIESNGV